MPSSAQLRPRKTPTQARSRATVEAILVAATQVLRRDGYAATTTDRVAKRAGVSVGSLYQYFPNKDAILVALTERHIDEGFALVRELLAAARADGPPLETMLRGFVVAMIALHEQEPELHRVLFEEAPLPSSLRRELRKRENDLGREVAELLEGRPEVRMGDSKLTGHIIVQTVDSLVHNFVLHPPKDIDAESLTDEIVRMLHQHLKGRSPMDDSP